MSTSEAAGPTLAELVQASGKRYTEIERASGGAISAPLVGRIVNKGHLPEYDNKITGLAKGLGVSVKKVREAIARSPHEHPYRTDLDEFRELNDKNREAVRAFTKALLESQRQVEELSDRIERAEIAAEIVEEVAHEAVENGPAEGVNDQLVLAVQNLLKRAHATPSDERLTGS